MTWDEANAAAQIGKLIRRRAWSATQTEFAWIFLERGLYYTDQFTVTNDKLTGKGLRSVVTNSRFTNAEFLASDWQTEDDYLTGSPGTGGTTPPKNGPENFQITITSDGRIDNKLAASFGDGDLLPSSYNLEPFQIRSTRNLGTGAQQEIAYSGIRKRGDTIAISVQNVAGSPYTLSTWTAIVTATTTGETWTYTGGRTFYQPLASGAGPYPLGGFTLGSTISAGNPGYSPN